MTEQAPTYEPLIPTVPEFKHHIKSSVSKTPESKFCEIPEHRRNLRKIHKFPGEVEEDSPVYVMDYRVSVGNTIRYPDFAFDLSCKETAERLIAFLKKAFPGKEMCLSERRDIIDFDNADYPENTAKIRKFLEKSFTEDDFEILRNMIGR